MKKLIAIILAGAMLFACTVGLSGCNLLFGKSGYSGSASKDPAYIKTTADGFKYIVNKFDDGVSLVGLPEGQEEVTIPMYINGKQVTQLGGDYGGFMWGKDYYLDFSGVTTVNILHNFQSNYVKNADDIIVIKYVDYIYGYHMSIEKDRLTLIRPSNRFLGSETLTKTEVWLINGGHDISSLNVSVETILISKFVTKIEKGVFDYLSSDTVIKTEYESKPEGWEDGWCGNCTVEWGATIDYV